MTVRIPQLSVVADMQVGEGCVVFAAIRYVRRGTDRKGNGYFDLIVSDASAKVAAKIWGDSKAYPEAESVGLGLGSCVGRVVVLSVKIDEYQGAIQLVVQRLRLVTRDDSWSPDEIWGAGWEHVEGTACKTLVFDIETVPMWDESIDALALPEGVAKSLMRSIESHEGDETKAMSLSPYFGKVVSLAFADGETDDEPTGFVVLPEGQAMFNVPENMRQMTEADLLRSFWHLADRADLVVSFNGRGFDLPFLITRSLILGVPVRVDLMAKPFALRPHLDLYHLLGHGRGRWGLGSASLDVVCWALGIPSPKGSMDGSAVAPAYAVGDIESIATYNAADVVATRAVYRYLLQHLLPYHNDW